MILIVLVIVDGRLVNSVVMLFCVWKYWLVVKCFWCCGFVRMLFFEMYMCVLCVVKLLLVMNCVGCVVMIGSFSDVVSVVVCWMYVLVFGWL